MDWHDLHARAAAVMPSYDLAKRYMIGILRPGNSLEQEYHFDDFVWMTIHEKIPIEAIRMKFSERYPDREFDLLLRGDVVPAGTLTRSLEYSGRLIVLQAVAKSPATFAEGTSRLSSPKIDQTIDDSDNSAIKLERTSTPPVQASPLDTVQQADSKNAVNSELSITPDESTEEGSAHRFIQMVVNQQTPEILEAGVTKSLKILETLKSLLLLCSTNDPDAVTRMKAIDTLRDSSVSSRTVMGVVGNTGGGKSSVINALLDEERLVPTNCMRACTAVVTELSWNESKDPNSKYRAEIEFVSHSDWEKELDVLMKEFLTENGNLATEASDQNSDAGIAWAKFRAVYPNIAKDMLKECTLEKLMSQNVVSRVLGTTKRINEAQPEKFYVELQKYVDSKEKVTSRKKDAAAKNTENKKQQQKNEPLSGEVWPLIKVVKIYTKSSALSTGAVVVDLPGVHDSNAARAAVADRYMKQCTGLWIVAPITRAVDDKAAKKLLGDSFRRQLKYDGNYANITFICTKTDDISITEAIDSLDMNDEISDLEDRRRSCQNEIETRKEKLLELKESVQMYRNRIDEAEKDIDLWKDLRDDHEDGKTVFAPVPQTPTKRKRRNLKPMTPRKKQYSIDFDSEIEASSLDSDISNDSDGQYEVEGSLPSQNPLTEKDINQKLEMLRITEKRAREEKIATSKQIPVIKQEIQGLKADLVEICDTLSVICIAGRNQYSKGAIQQDFAAGIRELDQENAAERDIDSFDPEEDLRDYEEVARSLPVFCVSSRAYQKMCGRLQKDAKVVGFNTLEETGMPQLRAHCKKLTEAGRIQTCQSFLNSLCTQLTSLSLWAANNSTTLNMPDEDMRKEMDHLQERLADLKNGMEQAAEACQKAMRIHLKDQIFNRYPELIEKAVKKAPGTVEKWAMKPAEGGIFYPTYKAVCRRGGVYRSPTAGLRDFNAELIEPVVKRLANGWERVFSNRLPNALETYRQTCSYELETFYEKTKERATKHNIGLANLALLKASMKNHEKSFESLGAEFIAIISDIQKDANRAFAPAVADKMSAAYEICTNEHGKGSFMRMKAQMARDVHVNRHTMFNEAAETVKNHLDDMCRSLDEKISSGAAEIFGKIRADHMLANGGVRRWSEMSEEEKKMREEIRNLLRDIDLQFRHLAKGHLHEEPEADGLRDHASITGFDRVLVLDDAENTSTRPGDSGQSEVMDGVVKRLSSSPSFSSLSHADVQHARREGEKVRSEDHMEEDW